MKGVNRPHITMLWMVSTISRGARLATPGPTVMEVPGPDDRRDGDPRRNGHAKGGGRQESAAPRQRSTRGEDFIVGDDCHQQ